MVSRVSDFQTSSLVLANLRRLQVKLQAVNEQATTGFRVNRPSDDPAGAGTVLRSFSTMNALNQDDRATGFAHGFLSAQDGVLGEAGDVITRAREIATQQANGVASDADRAAAASEVHALLEALVGLGNSDMGGRWLFSSGTDVVPGAEPFTDPNDPSFDPANPYTGSATPLQVQIGAGQLVRVTTTGSDVFGTAIAALDDLKSRLQAGTDPSVSLTALEQAAADISTERSSVGGRMEQIDDRVTQISRVELLTTESINTTRGADMEGILTNLVELQTQLQIAVAASQRIMETSLASALRF